MEINALCDFLCLAEVRNFRQAANAQGITTSGLSRRMKSLETFVGAELFDRSKNPVELTPAGEEMKALALDLLSYLKDAEDNTDLRFLSARFRKDVLPDLANRFATGRRQGGSLDHTVTRDGGAEGESALVPPKVVIRPFRNLSVSEPSAALVDAIDVSLTNQLSQSIFVDLLQSETSLLRSVDFLIEGTLVCRNDSVQLTLHLANAVSSELLLSKTYSFHFDDLVQSIEQIGWEFAWVLSQKIRSITYKRAESISAGKRSNFENFVLAHEKITSQLVPDYQQIDAACSEIENRKVASHHAQHLRGLVALRAWVKDPDRSDLLDEADTRFGDALHANPDYHPVLIGLATASCYKRDFHLAKTYLERAQFIAPGSTLGQTGAGIIHLSLGEYSRATETLLRAARFETTALLLSPVYACLALYLQGRYADAAAQIDVKRSPFPEAIALKMAALAQLREKGESLLLAASQSLLPESIKRFRMERYPLADKDARRHLIDGLKLAGVESFTGV